MKHLLLALSFSAVAAAAPAISAQSFPLKALLPSDGSADDLIGAAVDVDGTTAVVGGYGHDHVPTGGVGGAWIFELQAGAGWIETAELRPSDEPASSRFGYAVAAAGAVVMVGAPRDSTNLSTAGSVYVYTRQPGGSWLETQKLVASDANSGAEFGNSIAIDGDRAIVGAPKAKELGATIGAGYVFERQPDGSWLEVAKLVEVGDTQSDQLGFDASISGDRAVIGAHLQDDLGNSSGAAYVFERQPDGSWPMAQKLLASDGASSDQFGYSVAISGDRIVSGAWLDDDVGNGSGSAYVFERQASGTWTEVQKLVPASSTHFGFSVATDGAAVLIGAIHEIVGTSIDAGAAYLWIEDLSGTLQLAHHYTTTVDPTKATDDNFGHCVALSGGYAIVGASDHDHVALNSGLAEVLFSYEAAGVAAPLNQGAGSPGCAGPQTMGLGTAPLVGSPDFAFTCDNAPPSSVGFLGLGQLADVTGTDYGLGFLMHLSPLGSPLVFLGFQSDANGDATFPIAIPDLPGLAGTQWHAQSVWTWTTCSLPPFGFSSSDLLTFAFLQP